MNICLGSESNANAEVLFHWVNGIPRKKTPNLTWSVTLLNLFVTITTFKCYYIQHDVFFIMLPLGQHAYFWLKTQLYWHAMSLSVLSLIKCSLKTQRWQQPNHFQPEASKLDFTGFPFGDVTMTTPIFHIQSVFAIPSSVTAPGKFQCLHIHKCVKIPFECFLLKMCYLIIFFLFPQNFWTLVTKIYLRAEK